MRARWWPAAIALAWLPVGARCKQVVARVITLWVREDAQYPYNVVDDVRRAYLAARVALGCRCSDDVLGNATLLAAPSVGQLVVSAGGGASQEWAVGSSVSWRTDRLSVSPQLPGDFNSKCGDGSDSAAVNGAPRFALQLDGRYSGSPMPLLTVNLTVRLCVIAVEDNPRFADLSVRVRRGEAKEIRLGSIDPEGFALRNAKVTIDTSGLAGELYLLRCPARPAERKGLLAIGLNGVGAVFSLFAPQGNATLCYVSPSARAARFVGEDRFRYRVDEFGPDGQPLSFNRSFGAVSISIGSALVAQGGVLVAAAERASSAQLNATVAVQLAAADLLAPLLASEPGAAGRALRPVSFVLDALPSSGRLWDDDSGAEVLTTPFAVGVSGRLRYHPARANAFVDPDATLLPGAEEPRLLFRALARVNDERGQPTEQLESSEPAALLLRAVLSRQEAPAGWAGVEGLADGGPGDAGPAVTPLPRGAYVAVPAPMIAQDADGDVFPQLVALDLEEEQDAAEPHAVFRLDLNQTVDLAAFTLEVRARPAAHLREVLELASDAGQLRANANSTCAEQGCAAQRLWLRGPRSALNRALASLRVVSLWPAAPPRALRLQLSLFPAADPARVPSRRTLYLVTVPEALASPEQALQLGQAGADSAAPPQLPLSAALALACLTVLTLGRVALAAALACRAPRAGPAPDCARVADDLELA
jgi:hypothetical protein